MTLTGYNFASIMDEFLLFLAAEGQGGITN